MGRGGVKKCGHGNRTFLHYTNMKAPPDCGFLDCISKSQYIEPWLSLPQFRNHFAWTVSINTPFPLCHSWFYFLILMVKRIKDGNALAKRNGLQSISAPCSHFNTQNNGLVRIQFSQLFIESFKVFNFWTIKFYVGFGVQSKLTWWKTRKG